MTHGQIEGHTLGWTSHGRDQEIVLVDLWWRIYDEETHDMSIKHSFHQYIRSLPYVFKGVHYPWPTPLFTYKPTYILYFILIIQAYLYMRISHHIICNYVL